MVVVVLGTSSSALLPLRVSLSGLWRAPQTAGSSKRPSGRLRACSWSLRSSSRSSLLFASCLRPPPVATSRAVDRLGRHKDHEWQQHGHKYRQSPGVPDRCHTEFSLAQRSIGVTSRHVSPFGGPANPVGPGGFASPPHDGFAFIDKLRSITCAKFPGKPDWVFLSPQTHNTWRSPKCCFSVAHLLMFCASMCPGVPFHGSTAFNPGFFRLRSARPAGCRRP